MIEKKTLEKHLMEILEGTGIFLVDVKVYRNNRILVQVDRKEGISLDECARVSRALEGRLDRDREDFALEVSSPGIDAPFRVPEQYAKNTGKMVSVQYVDGRRQLGVLLGSDDKRIRLEIPAAGQGDDPKNLELDHNQISTVRLHVQL
jgi:ribosome maturation factor RimP